MKSMNDWKRPSLDLRDVELTLPQLPPTILQLNFTGEQVQVQNDSNTRNSFAFAKSEVHFASVRDITCLTSGNDVKRAWNICLDVKDLGVPYNPGDTIGVLPCNSATELETLVRCLNIENRLQTNFRIGLLATCGKKKSVPVHIPQVSTLDTVFRTLVDIRTVPKKVLLRVLAEYTSDTSEKRRLEELSSKEGAHHYTKYILERGTSLLDILTTFNTCQPPVERLLELLPRLQPRVYSIASSPLSSPGVIQIAVSVVEHPRRGLCSGWLDDSLSSASHVSNDALEKRFESLTLLDTGSPLRIPIFLRKSNGFTLPDDPAVPLILVGPGTGIAPFIGFLQHRAEERRRQLDVVFGDIWLFYGCRYYNRDFLFRSEVEQYLQNGVISRLFTSFSRDDSSEEHTKYVQDNIKLHSKEFINQFLEKKSIIYVCGDAKNMGKAVWETVAKCIANEKGISQENAHSMLSELKKSGRYLQDLWL